MKSFYKSRDGMRKDFLQNEQKIMMKETFNDSRKIFKDISQNTFRKFSVIIIILVTIIIFGGIDIPNKRIYDIEFELSITGVNVRSTVHTEYKKPYIPFILYSTADIYGEYNSDTVEKKQKYNKLTDINVFLLTVTAYRCYNINDEINIEAGCSVQNPNNRLTNDPHTLTKVKSRKVKYTGLKIIDKGHNSEVLYDGELIQDLSNYIYKPSTYEIFIYAEYDYSKATISTTIEVGDQ